MIREMQTASQNPNGMPRDASWNGCNHRQRIPSIQQGQEKLEPSNSSREYKMVGECKRVQMLCETVWQLLKWLHKKSSHDSAIPLLEIHSWQIKRDQHKRLCSHLQNNPNNSRNNSDIH